MDSLLTGKRARSRRIIDFILKKMPSLRLDSYDGMPNCLRGSHRSSFACNHMRHVLLLLAFLGDAKPLSKA